MTTWPLVVIAFVSGMAGAWVAQVLMAITRTRRGLERHDRSAAGVAGSLAGKSYDEIFKR